MSLTNQQIQKLLNLVASVQDDSMDCDGCYHRISEFVERQLEGQPLDAAMHAVELHLANCPCCADEYRVLKAGLTAMRDAQSPSGSQTPSSPDSPPREA